MYSLAICSTIEDLSSVRPFLNDLRCHEPLGLRRLTGGMQHILRSLKNIFSDDLSSR